MTHRWRRVVAWGVLAALLAWAVAVAAQEGRARGYRMYVHSCTDVRAPIVGANAARVGIRLMNLGSQTVMIGGSEGAHVSGLTGWPLHAAANLQQSHALSLSGGGYLECVVINTTTPATAHIGVIEFYQ